MGNVIGDAADAVGNTASDVWNNAGSLLGNAGQTAIDFTGVNGLRPMAKAATATDIGFLPDSVNNILQEAAPTVLSFIPGYGPAISAGYSAAQNYGNGGSLGSSLASGAKAYGLGELGGVAQNELGLGGGNTLTDLLGSTQGAGSLGAPSLFSTSVGSNGLQTGTGLAAGSSNAPMYNISGGGGSSFANGSSGSDVLSGSGSSSPVGIDALTSNGSSSVPNLNLGNTYSGGLPTASSSPFSNVSASLPSASSGSSIGSLLGKYGLPLAGTGVSLASNMAAQDQLKKSTTAANAQLSPYLQTGAAASTAAGNYLGLPGSTGSGTTSADILAASPGYNFALQQGNRALAAQQAASGSLNSGAAQKAALQFGTGLANQTGQQYLSNLQGIANQGLGAAGQYGNNTTALGSAGANANIATGNTISQLLSGVGGKRVTGYNQTNGQPIYG